MDWQQVVSLGIVALTVVILLWNRFKPQKFSFQRHTQCGCASSSQATPRNTIVMRARKGERPRITVKMK